MQNSKPDSQKQLNPELFGDFPGNKTRMIDAPAANQAMVTEQRVTDLKMHLAKLTESFSRVVGQMNEFMKNTQGKFETVQQEMHKLEQNDHLINMETAHKFNQIHNKLADRHQMDMKIQEMIDRHNSILKSYEVRMNQMQKMMAEKDATLISAQGALNEAKMEIMKLKRF